MHDLGLYGVATCRGVFGYTVWGADDTGIGQNIEDLARYVDVLSPMIYPSSFHLGIPGYPAAIPRLSRSDRPSL